MVIPKESCPGPSSDDVRWERTRSWNTLWRTFGEVVCSKRATLENRIGIFLAVTGPAQQTKCVQKRVR